MWCCRGVVIPEGDDLQCDLGEASTPVVRSQDNLVSGRSRPLTHDLASFTGDCRGPKPRMEPIISHFSSSSWLASGGMQERVQRGPLGRKPGPPMALGFEEAVSWGFAKTSLFSSETRYRGEGFVFSCVTRCRS